MPNPTSNTFYIPLGVYFTNDGTTKNLEILFVEKTSATVFAQRWFDVNVISKMQIKIADYEKVLPIRMT